MRVCVCVCVCVCLYSTPLSTYPTARKTSGSTTPVMSSLSATKKLAMNIPNPLNSLPWNVKKAQQRAQRNLKTESANLHRQLGIADDATFEEITEVTNHMIAKANSEGDVKKKIKVEMAKDRIMQIKLNERLAGMMEVTDDAKAQSRLEEQE